VKALYNLGNNIYWLTFETKYEMGMTLWRISETKESTNPLMKHGLSLVDFMEWYADEYGKGIFTYPDDWAGYNVHQDDFKHTYSSGQIQDYNKYDKVMTGLRNYLEGMCNSSNPQYYLMATLEGDYDTLEHEYAHALWGISQEYQLAQKKNIEALDEKVRNTLCSNLLKMAYVEQVHEDEIQAYLSTGFDTVAPPKDKFYAPIVRKEMVKIAKSFINVFKDASKGKLPRKRF